MKRPCWPRRAVRNRHRHAIEQASRRWRGRTRREFDFHTGQEETKWGFGVKVDAQIKHQNVNYDQRSQRGFSVADAVVGDGLMWTYLRVRGMQRAGALTRALEVAFDRGMLDQRALYVVNAGLWHLLCTTNMNECLETYENDVERFLKVLTARADGPVLCGNQPVRRVHPTILH